MCPPDGNRGPPRHQFTPGSKASTRSKNKNGTPPTKIVFIIILDCTRSRALGWVSEDGLDSHHQLAVTDARLPASIHAFGSARFISFPPRRGRYTLVPTAQMSASGCAITSTGGSHAAGNAARVLASSQNVRPGASTFTSANAVTGYS